MTWLIVLAALAEPAFAQKITNMTLVGQCEIGAPGSGACLESTGANDISGYEAGGSAYAIMGVREGTVIYDVSTDPANPAQVAFVAGPTSIWRDIKTFGNFAYVVHDTTPDTPIGLQIIDLSGLPGSVSVVNTYSATFNRGHNLFIDETDATLYVCRDSGAASGFNSRGIHILSLADPTDPVEIGVYNNRAVHDVYVRNNTAYAACLSQGLWFIDVTDKTNPQDIVPPSPVTYANPLTHNVWLTDDGNYALTTDENLSGHLRIWAIQDLANVVQVAEYETRPDDQLVIHNVVVKGDYAYISYYTEGVVVLDISDPTQPCEIGYYDTDLFVVPPVHSVSDVERGVWGVYPFASNGRIYASDIEQGLFLFDFIPPDRPPIDMILTLDISGSMSSPATSGGDPKIQVLKDAVEIFLNTWLSVTVPDDRLGIVYFESAISQYPTGSTVIPIPFCTNFQAFIDEVRNITTGDFTAMGGGLLRTFRGFDDASSARKSAILFTDGMQNFSPMVVESKIEAVFFDLGDTLAFRPSPGADYVWFPDAQSTVADLKARGVRVGIITNTPAGWTRTNLEGILDDPSFLSEFEVVLLSSQVPCSKPCLGIFNHALSLLGNPPPASHVAFVTEEITHLINDDDTGAQGAGWRGIHKASLPATDAEFRVDDLSEIAGVVDGVATPLRHEILTVPIGAGVWGESGEPGEPGSTIADFGVDLHCIAVGVQPSYQDLLASIASETPDGLFHATTAPDDALRQFFENGLVNALRGTTLELIDHRTGSLTRQQPSSVESFALNRSIRHATFVVSWRKARRVDAVELELISPDGTPIDLAGLTRKGEIFSIVSIPFPLQQRSGRVEPEGDWKVHLRGTFGDTGTIPYHVSVLVDELVLEYRFGPRQRVFAAGDPIPLSAEVRLGTVPAANLDTVSVAVTGPSRSFADILAGHRIDRTMLAQNDFGIHQDHFPRLLEKKKFDLQQRGLLTQDRFSKQVVLHDDGAPAHGDDVAGDGIYSGLFTNTSVPGRYDLTYLIAGDTAETGAFARTERASVLVTVHRADRNQSKVAVVPGDPRSDGLLDYLVNVTPRDALGNLLGPGYPHKISVSTSSGQVGPIEDMLDGTYRSVLTLAASAAAPQVSISVAGELLTTVGLDRSTGGRNRSTVVIWIFLVLIVVLLIVLLARRSIQRP